MPFVHGKAGKLLVDQFDLSAYFNDFTSNGKADAAETTTFGKNAKTFIAGLQQGQMACKGYFDGSAAAVDAVLTPILGRAADANVIFAPAGSLAVAQRIVVGAGIETDYTVSAPVSGVVNVSASFEADGGLQSGVSLMDNATNQTTIGAAQLGTGVNDTGMASPLTTNAGAYGVLSITAFAGTTSPTITVAKLQSSDDNVTYADITGGAFALGAGAVAVGSYYVAIAPGVTISRFVRVNFTTTGATIAANFTVGFARL